jgi:hypothetical protein
MTRKIAVFVEGFTEQEFAVRVIKEIIGKRTVDFQMFVQEFGSLAYVTAELSGEPHPEFEIMIANCCTDNQVKSKIIETYKNLVALDYHYIIGLRDIFPLTLDELADVQTELTNSLPIGAVPISIHLAVLEIESWFLEEITHFEKIDPAITQQMIISNGFDFNAIRASNLAHPSRTLDNIYKSVNKRYAKKKSQISRTVKSLSYEEIYVNVRQKDNYLDGFISILEHSLFA